MTEVSNNDVPPGARWATSDAPMQPPGLGDARIAATMAKSSLIDAARSEPAEPPADAPAPPPAAESDVPGLSNTDAPPGARWATTETPMQPAGLGEARRAQQAVLATPVSLIKPVERNTGKKIVKLLATLVVVAGVGAGAVFGIKSMSKDKPADETAAETTDGETPAEEVEAAFDDNAVAAAEDIVADINAAGDPFAQNELRSAYSAAKVYFTDNETYATLTAEQLAVIEPSLTYADPAAASADAVVVYAYGPTEMALARQSSTGTWFCLSEKDFETTYGSGATFDEAVANCSQPSW